MASTEDDTKSDLKPKILEEPESEPLLAPKDDFPDGMES